MDPADGQSYMIVYEVDTKGVSNFKNVHMLAAIKRNNVHMCLADKFILTLQESEKGCEKIGGRQATRCLAGQTASLMNMSRQECEI